MSTDTSAEDSSVIDTTVASRGHTISAVSAIVNEVRRQSNIEVGRGDEEKLNGSYGSRSVAQIEIESDFDSMMEELGINPDKQYRYNHLGAIIRSKPCIYCMITSVLITVSIIIATSVNTSFRHSHTPRHPGLNPQWMVTEKTNKTKDWWVKEHEEIHSKTMSDEELEHLYYSVSDNYLPVWYNRDTGWKGQTYPEAMMFCAHNMFVVCPYEVYCPGNGKKVIFDEIMGEEELWAPMFDAYNGWVQVGKNGGVDTCATYSEVHGEQPNWGLSGSNEEMTRFILCCLEDPLLDVKGKGKVAMLKPPDVEEEHGVEVDDPIPPFNPSPGMEDAPIVAQYVEQAKHGNPPPPQKDQSQFKGLNAFEQQIRDTYAPFWFDSESSGWNGTTWAAAKDFCESISFGSDGTFRMCPAKVYCASRENLETPLVYRMKPFEGVQWSPVSDIENSWIMTGNSWTGDQPSPSVTCHTYLDLFQKIPEWSLTGHSPELKQHLLCCKASLESEGDDNAEYEQSHGTAELPPQTGAGNSSPHIGEQHTDDQINSLDNALKPTWYDTDAGWSSGSHDSAREFCNDMTTLI